MIIFEVFPSVVYRLVCISVGPMLLVLETMVIRKIESHPCNPIIWAWFSWGWHNFLFLILNDWWIGGMWFVTFFFFLKMMPNFWTFASQSVKLIFHLSSFFLSKKYYTVNPCPQNFPTEVMLLYKSNLVIIGGRIVCQNANEFYISKNCRAHYPSLRLFKIARLDSYAESGSFLSETG